MVNDAVSRPTSSAPSVGTGREDIRGDYELQLGRSNPGIDASENHFRTRHASLRPRSKLPLEREESHERESLDGVAELRRRGLFVEGFVGRTRVRVG